MLEVRLQRVFAAQARIAFGGGRQIIAPCPARKWIEIGQTWIVDEGGVARTRILFAGDMGGYERGTAGLHHTERLVAERGLVAADHAFGQRGWILTVERATAPRRRVVEAVAYEQMGMLEAALARPHRGVQRHGLGQVADQRTAQLLRLGGQPLVGVRTQLVVDLQRVDTARAVRACTLGGGLRRE